jgi:hypothetical protein
MSIGLSSLAELPHVDASFPMLGIEYLLMTLVAAFFILTFFWQNFMEQRHIQRVLESKSEAEGETIAAPALTPAE